jgi:hypothetical protein
MPEAWKVVVGLAAGILPAAGSAYFFAIHQSLLALILVVAAYLVIIQFPSAVLGAAPPFLIAAVYYLLAVGDLTPVGIYLIFFFGCFVVYYFAS